MATPFKSYTTRTGKTVLQLLMDKGVVARKALAKQLYLEAEGIMAQSKPLVPVDTGALRSSGFVELPVITPTDISVTLGYGGPATRLNPKTGEATDTYALYVHEDLEAHHKVGTAKFLEMPFDQAKAGMSARIAQGMKADLNAGTAGEGIMPMNEE